jgi:hypothetical protein
VLKDVSARDLTVATGLMTLNEIRQAAMKDFTPFADDLKVIEKIAGNQPKIQERLTQLAPLAAEGVLSPASLQKEFQAMAGEIALAKMRGENISLRDKAEEHLNKAIKIRKNDPSAQNNAGAVARAKAALARGDTKTALAELQSLDEAGKTVAKPWMQEAEKRVVADQSIDQMINDFITGFQLGGIGAAPGSAADFGGAAKHLLNETRHGTQAPIVSP